MTTQAATTQAVTTQAVTTQELDLMDPKTFGNGIPHDHFRRLRRSDRLIRGTDTDGESLWHLVRHRDVAAVSRDARTFSSSPTTMTSIRKVDPSPPIITFLDSPEHTRIRKLTFKAFAPARLAALQAPIRRIVDTLLAQARDKGTFDLAEDIALRLPFEVLLELLDIPHEDRDSMLGWARQTVNLGDEEYDGDGTAGQDSFQKIYEYLLDFARHRAEHPTDDCFSLLLDARLNGAGRLGLPDRLTADEVGLFASTLITAGSETTYCSVTGGVLALLDFPDQLDRLRADRSLLPSATNEVLRWVTPVTHFARRAVTDTEVAGQPIAEGERVVMWYSSANRDEEVFTDPDRFDVARTPNPHLSFGGGGPHVCIGNGLAVMELRQFLEGAVDLLPQLEITAPPVRPETNFMNSVKHLHMRFR
ncbi:cytochrome P450 [Kitasatospora sp. GP82]|uniref:cytochrome P450 n=1 Tax=Kitasatospora sp. GP82 TaxID=3035089 RepID=UPI00247418E6|nr:cytochrome P450 [Kitasatospora sp. GP82]MDH6129137.1 cholest-4-en-3-one 26-monooxygenase [Kitasatospora sp. GP82]